MKLPTTTNLILVLMHCAITSAIFYFNPVFAYLYVLGIIIVSMHMDKKEIEKINVKIEQVKSKKASLEGTPQISALDAKLELKIEESHLEKLKEENADLVKMLKWKVISCWFILICFIVFVIFLYSQDLLF